MKIWTERFSKIYEARFSHRQMNDIKTDDDNTELCYNEYFGSRTSCEDHSNTEMRGLTLLHVLRFLSASYLIDLKSVAPHFSGRSQKQKRKPIKPNSLLRFSGRVVNEIPLIIFVVAEAKRR